MIVKCKYCRANTDHTIIQPLERNGLKGIEVKCNVCKWTKAVFRKGKELIIDDTGVPERSILLPYDTEYIQSEIVDQTQEDAHKEIDNWLHNKDRWPGFRKDKN